jgi:hypothetical protein
MNTWNNTFKELKEHNCQSRLLYPSMLSLRIDGEMKNFQDQQKLKQSQPLSQTAGDT